MERWSGTVAIVTGCTAGIGLAITKELIKYNIVVVGLARRVEKLKSLEKEFPKKFYGKTCDVNRKGDIFDAFKYVEDKFGAASILINNAGVLTPTSILDVKDEEIDEMIRVNVDAIITFCREAVKAMIAKSIAGHIINVNSSLGDTNYPTEGISPFGIYTATHSAITAFTEDLRRELYERKTNIKASTIKAGFTNTDMIVPLGKYQGDMQPIEPEDVAKGCMTILNTSSNVLITSLEMKPIREKY